MNKKENREVEAWEVNRKHSGSISRPPAKSAQEYIAEHTIAAGETLSHVALKYYGSAAKDKWMPIYEANKGVIGDNPNRVSVGMVLKIPKLA